jgi:hypothetical protein
MKWKIICCVTNANLMHPFTLLILVCNEDVHHMRLQRIINIPLL